MRLYATMGLLAAALCFAADGETANPAPPDPKFTPVVDDNMAMVVLNAVRALDPKKDTDWTEGGKPSLKRVRQIAKNSDITQEELDAAAPLAYRPPYEQPGPAGRGTLFSGATAEAETSDPVNNVMMIATSDGYAMGSLRRPGEMFLFSGIAGSWMRPATKDEIKAYQDARG
jgi:hypothetical protein